MTATTPDQPASAPVMTADEAREALLEMVAVVRTIFASARQHESAYEPQHASTPQDIPAHQPEPEHVPSALPLPEAEPVEAPQTAAFTSVPMPAALAVEADTVATPGATSPTAAPSTPALAMPPAQPVELPPLEQPPVINALPMPDYAPPVEPSTPERHSMVMLQEIAFLDD